MKKIIIVVVLSVFGGLCAMEEKTITLASANILESRLCSQHFKHFVEKTKIHETMGGQQLEPLAVALNVEMALYDYSKTVDPMVAEMTVLRKPQLFALLLEEHPYAIDNLKHHGILD